MKALLLILLLQFGDPGLSKKVVVSHDPRITIQSRIGEIGTNYDLLLEVTSKDDGFGPASSPCNASVVVDGQTLALDCHVARNEIIADHTWSQLTISSIDKRSVQKAHSVKMKVGGYEFTLTRNQVRSLNLGNLGHPEIFNPLRPPSVRGLYKARLNAASEGMAQRQSRKKPPKVTSPPPLTAPLRPSIELIEPGIRHLLEPYRPPKDDPKRRPPVLKAEEA